MTAILAFVLANPIIVAGVAIAVFLAGFWIKAKRAGKAQADAKWMKQQIKEKKANDQLIITANRARHNVDPDSVRNDPQNRDNR